MNDDEFDHDPNDMLIQEAAEGFKMSEIEYQRFKEWAVTLPPRDPGVQGGRFTFAFTPTTIGCVVVIRSVCGAKINVTDYDCW